MDYPRLPAQALIQTRGPADGNPQVQELRPGTGYYPEQRERLYQQLTAKLLSFYLQNDHLPSWNEPSFRTPRFKFPTLPRRRSEVPQQDRSHSRASILLRSDECFSAVNEQNQGSSPDREEILNNSPGSNCSYSEVRKAEHNTRLEELRKKVGAMLPENGSPVILICWGEASDCSVLPVPVSTSDDECSTWTEMNRVWYSHRGHWRKYLPGFGVTNLEIVDVRPRFSPFRRITDENFKISLLGLQNNPQGRQRCQYIGKYKEYNIPAERKRLQKIIDNYVSMSECSYNHYTGNVDCDVDCLCWECFPEQGFADKCEVTTLYDAKRNVSFLDTLSLMKHAFSDPLLASSNDFLKKQDLILSQRYVRTTCS